MEEEAQHISMNNESTVQQSTYSIQFIPRHVYRYKHFYIKRRVHPVSQPVNCFMPGQSHTHTAHTRNVLAASSIQKLNFRDQFTMKMHLN